MLYVCNMVRHPLKNKFSIYCRILFFLPSNFELYNNIIIQIRLLLHVRTTHISARHRWRVQTRDVCGGTSHHTHTHTPPIHTPHIQTHTYTHVHTDTHMCEGMRSGPGPTTIGVSARTYTTTHGTQGR